MSNHNYQPPDSLCVKMSYYNIIIDPHNQYMKHMYAKIKGDVLD